MNRTCAVAALVIGASWTTAALADPPQLKGDYAFTGTAACLVSPGHWDAPTGLSQNPSPGVLAPGSGFNDKFQPNDGGPNSSAFTRSYSVEGIRTFDGHGHGHVSGTVVGILDRPTPGPTGWPHFPPSASSADFSFDFIYSVDGNGGWTSSMVGGSYMETFTSGPRGPQVGPPSVAAQTATVDAIPPISGTISNDGKTLTAAHLTPAVEVHSYSNGDVWPEVCHRSRVFIKLNPSDDDGHDH